MREREREGAEGEVEAEAGRARPRTRAYNGTHAAIGSVTHLWSRPVARALRIALHTAQRDGIGNLRFQFAIFLAVRCESVKQYVFQFTNKEKKSCHIWSSGVILYVLLAGFLPFDDDNANVLFQKICTIDFQYPPSFSLSAIDLLNNIFVESGSRYTIEQIKRHEWFQRSDDVYLEQPLVGIFLFVCVL